MFWIDNKSTIRRRLLVGLTAVVLLLWGIVGAFVYRAAQEEVEEVFDAALAQEARVLATLLLHEAEEEEERTRYLQQLLEELGPSALEESPLLAQLAEQYLGNGEEEDYLTPLSQGDAPGHRYESKIAFLVRYADGRVMIRSPNAPTFDVPPIGFHTLEWEATPWRVFGLELPDSGLLVQVSEKQSVRQETVRYILVNSLWPMVLSLPVLGLIIYGLVGSGLRPLQRVAESVGRRDPGSLQPISTDAVPGEVVPMVEALNGLFQRVHHTLENERRFTANAAHELRTPLAALKTQAQAAQLNGGSGKFAPFLEQIVVGVDRATHLLEQLLTLARADAQQSETILQRQADLHGVARNLLAAIGEQALAKEINLSMEGETQPTFVRGDGDALAILLRNLVDNAIRYTPAGGEVTVRILKDADGVSLEVVDSGPGIPQAQRDTLFRRFQRGEGVEVNGSGLGLSIVKQIAHLHQAEVSLSEGADGKGLVVRISFPS
jgi:two-component system sensor histidine kinase QseC